MLPWWTKLRWPVLSIDGSCHVWNSQKPEEFRPGRIIPSCVGPQRNSSVARLLSICKDNPFALLLRCEITNHSYQVWVRLSGDMLNFKEDVLLGRPSIPSWLSMYVKSEIRPAMSSNNWRRLRTRGKSVLRESGTSPSFSRRNSHTNREIR